MKDRFAAMEGGIVGKTRSLQNGCGVIQPRPQGLGGMGIGAHGDDLAPSSRYRRKIS